jgi:DNA-binding helix-hairpin-helix protein with protein kinase domain
MNLAWPSEVVLADGRFAGLLMPAVDTRQTVELHRITNPTDRRTATGAAAWTKEFDWRYLVRTAANLAHATHVLHAAGVVIGDFNESNIRTWREARVTLLDCDSMQIRDPASGEWFFCRVGRPEFTPPELVRADWASTVRHPSSDLFALAIHLYQLLLEGEHPFRGVWRGDGEKPAVSVLAGRGIWAHQNGGPLVPRPAAISAAQADTVFLATDGLRFMILDDLATAAPFAPFFEDLAAFARSPQASDDAVRVPGRPG